MPLFQQVFIPKPQKSEKCPSSTDLKMHTFPAVASCVYSVYYKLIGVINLNPNYDLSLKLTKLKQLLEMFLTWLHF